MQIFSPVFLAIITAFSMAGGQLLFKTGAESWEGASIYEWGISFLKNIYLVSGVFLYAITILIWIYVLKHLPLSFAYPITALSYVIVPILSIVILQEKVSIQTIIGSATIICGITIIHLNLS